VNGTTMSKSKGNYYTLRDLLANGYSAMAVRYALLAGHPRKQLNFTLDGLHAAESALKTLRDFRASLSHAGAAHNTFGHVLTELHNDLNTPGAFGAIFTIINRKSGEVDVESFDRVMFALGLDLKAVEAPKADIPETIAQLAKQRWEAKLGKDWAKADTLRKALSDKGWSMKDAKDSYTLEPLKK
jgi:cysteinyl-tRNA synthetase